MKFMHQNREFGCKKYYVGNGREERENKQRYGKKLKEELGKKSTGNV